MSASGWSVVVSGVGVLIALIALLIESARARFSRGVELLMLLDDRFESAEFRRTRRRAVEYVAAGLPPEEFEGRQALEDVLNYFENVAYLLRRGALDVRSVWQSMETWLIPYYVLSEPYIARCQVEDGEWYAELDALVARVHDLDQRKKSGTAARPALTAARRADFLAAERSLLLPGQL